MRERGGLDGKRGPSSVNDPRVRIEKGAGGATVNQEVEGFRRCLSR